MIACDSAKVENPLQESMHERRWPNVEHVR